MTRIDNKEQIKFILKRHLTKLTNSPLLQRRLYTSIDYLISRQYNTTETFPQTRFLSF